MAVIDVNRIMTDSARGKAVLAGIEKLQSERSAQLKTLNEELTEMQKRFQEGRLSLAEDKLAELQAQIEEKDRAFKRAREDAERDVQKRRADEIEKIESAVFPIINGLGKEGGYTIIFNKFQSGLVYADDAVDITDEVIKRLDAAGAAGSLRQVDVTFRLGELAARVGGRVAGDPQRPLHGLRPLSTAGPEHLSFFTDPTLRAEAEASAAGALLTGPSTQGLRHDLLVAADPGLALIELLRAFHPEPSAARRRPCDRGGGAGRAHRAGRIDRRLRGGGRGCDDRRRSGAPSVRLRRSRLPDRRWRGSPSSRRALPAHGGGRAGGAPRRRGGRAPTASATSPAADATSRCRRSARAVLEDEVEVGANSAIDRATLDETRVGSGHQDRQPGAGRPQRAHRTL